MKRNRNQKPANDKPVIRPDGEANTEPNVPLASVQCIWTGILGALVVLIGAVRLAVLSHADVELPFHEYRYLVILVLAFLVMAIYELGVVGIHRRNFDWGRSASASQGTFTGMAMRFVGLCLTLATVWFAYAVFLEYQVVVTDLFHFDFSSSWYRPFFGFFWVATLAVLVLSLPYFYLCERFGRWSQGEDDLLCIVRGYLALVRGRKPEPAFLAVWRGYLVKFFFVPLMVVFWISNTQTFEKALLNLLNQEHWWSWDVYAISRLYDVAFEGMFLVDVSLALLGYICTFRLFDTHIRSAEPTLVGWFVALACYPPFSRTADLYLAYNNGQHYWGSTLANYPVLFALVAATIIFLQFVYAYSTVMFGLRFSNLTNRGILCKGPYAVIRHPAYVAKNISWWLVSLPFLFSFGDCVRLLCMNALYVGRAITEERHLGRDPDYQEYMRRVKYRFIPGVW